MFYTHTNPIGLVTVQFGMYLKWLLAMPGWLNVMLGWLNVMLGSISRFKGPKLSLNKFGVVKTVWAVILQLPHLK